MCEGVPSKTEKDADMHIRHTQQAVEGFAETSDMEDLTSSGNQEGTGDESSGYDLDTGYVIDAVEARRAWANTDFGDSEPDGDEHAGFRVQTRPAAASGSS